MKLGRKERIKEFQKLRCEGIVAFNKDKASKDIPEYQSERKKRKYFDIVLCSSCSAFISKRFFHAHKKNCQEESETVVSAIPMYLQQLPFNNFSEGFVEKILSTMMDDNTGRIVRRDPNILYLGDKFYRLTKHKKEKSANVWKSVRGQVRLLASLYSIFCS